MKNKRINLKLGKITNIGDYENVKVDIELSGDIGDKDFADEMKRLSMEGHKILRREINIITSEYME